MTLIITWIWLSENCGSFAMVQVILKQESRKVWFLIFLFLNFPFSLNGSILLFKY